MICDKEGVPLLIQGMKYLYSSMTFEVRFFNGRKVEFGTEFFCPTLELLAREPTRMQWLEAEDRITRYVEQNYRKLFPEFTLHVVK